ncbi:MAG: copper homeostasis protein CutC [Mangrovimonas sp.]|nr:copper homeostasis protein CutC [Mangrovimonas sp.]
MLLEICANSFQSAKNAQEAGAHRIELCSELSVGGITPSYGLLKKVVETLSIEAFVLIRPRSGNFVYSAAEFEVMKRDIEVAKQAGCHGIVSGALTEDFSIDIQRTQELIALSNPLPFTFHRAFDEVSNPEEALEQLADLGVTRILSSGQKASAENGLELLIKLNRRATHNIIIMPGGGINPSNAKLFKQAGFREIHASASKPIESVGMPSIFEMQQTVSDTGIIKAILNEI